MNFDHKHYAPCIRWKMGEYLAMLNFFNITKDFIMPLIEVPEIGFDFAKGRPSKSVDDHLLPFAKRLREKWERRSCFVDLKTIEPAMRMANGLHPMTFVFDELRSQSCTATPVTGLDRDQQYRQAIRQVVSEDQRGLCLRVSIEEAARQSLKSSVDTLLRDIGLKVKDCDFVLDLGAPNFVPVDGFAKLIHTIIEKLPYLKRWQTFTIIGTSFPQSMGEIKKGSTTIQRFEWLLYKTLIRSLAQNGDRLPTFGDYTINHPGILPMDMRLLKPSATIRYTAEDSWFVVKGTNVRDNGFEQYREHCRTVMASPYYMGPEFSHGDKYIADCATDTGKTGNLSTWRNVGTNHHLEKVVSDISSFFGSSGRP